jgi:putative ABC transport system substrate-binding protein
VNRRAFITLLGGAAAAWPVAARAQQSERVRRIGVLMLYQEGNPDVQGWLAAFHEALRKLGWAEARNISFEYRWVGTDPTRMQQSAKELVALQPDLIVSSSSPTTAALLQETRAVPIVFMNLVDPVGQGFVASLPRPGGNATGLVNLEASMVGKWIELLKQVVPDLARVAVPFHSPTTQYADIYLGYFRATAPALGVEIVPAPVQDLAGFHAVVAAQARAPGTALIPIPGGFATGHLSEIAAMTARHRLPAIYSLRAFVEAGGLLSYGNDITDNYRRAAVFVDRILKGEKPSDLPVEFPVKFTLAVNLKTAKSLGLAVPDRLLATADEVIE